MVIVYEPTDKNFRMQREPTSEIEVDDESIVTVELVTGTWQLFVKSEIVAVLAEAGEGDRV
jgi:hypothetical protein